MAKIRSVRAWRSIGKAEIGAWLPRRPADAHKGDFGRVLLLCGAVGYTGAAVLAAQAAARTGAGLVFAGVARTAHTRVAGRRESAGVLWLAVEAGML